LISCVHARTRRSTLRRQLIHLTADLTRHARGVRLGIPSHWPRTGLVEWLFDETHRPLLT